MKSTYTTHGLIYSFQVVFSGTGTGSPPGTLHLEAETRAAVEQRAASIAAQLGVKVLDIGPGRPLLTPGRLAYRKDEAAALLGYEEGTLDRLLAEGKLSRPHSGLCVFKQADLEAVL